MVTKTTHNNPKTAKATQNKPQQEHEKFNTSQNHSNNDQDIDFLFLYCALPSMFTC